MTIRAKREFLCLGLVLMLAAVLRLANLGSGVFIAGYDEGVYSESARMIIEGYAPHVQVFSSQPAHFVLTLAAFFELFGMSIVSARLFIVITSLIAIMSTYLIAKSIEDWKAGLVAAFVLCVSPFFLRFSRIVNSAVPSIGFVLLGVWLFFSSLKNERNSYITLSGAAVSLGTMMKLDAGLAVIPILILLIARKNVTRIVSFLTGFMVPLLILPFFDLHKVVDQVIIFHVSKPANDTWLSRASIIPDVLRMDLGLTSLASIGALLCVIRKRLEGRFILILSGVYFLFFVAYRALFIGHVVIVLPLLAIMSGIGLVAPLNLWWKEARGGDANERRGKVKAEARRNSLFVLLVIGLCVIYAVAAVPVARNDSILISAANDIDSRGQDVVAIIRAHSNQTDYIITDSQMLAFVAGRDVPPDLVDTSDMRIRSGYLDSNDVIRSAEEYRVKVIAFCTGRLILLGEFVQYVKANFGLVANFEGCQVYARSDSSVSCDLCNIQSTDECLTVMCKDRQGSPISWTTKSAAI
jgi:hypothetical protein